MPNRAHEQTEQIRAELLQYLKRLYDSADRKIQADIEDLLIAIYLDDEAATQRQRIKHAEQNGLNEIIEIFVAVMLLTNERAIRRINRAMNNVAGINYEYVQNKIKRVTGIDIRGSADKFDPTKYTKRAYNRNTRSKFVSDSVMKEIRKGIKSGENVKQISNRIKRVSNKSRISANATAQTETTRIRSESKLDAMQEAYGKYGIRTKKVWRHSHFVKTARDWHLSMDGTEIFFDEMFVVDGIDMDGPGDPNGGAENNINCRCYLDFEVE